MISIADQIVVVAQRGEGQWMAGSCAESGTARTSHTATASKCSGGGTHIYFRRF